MHTSDSNYFSPRLDYKAPDMMKEHTASIAGKHKLQSKTLFVSATPADYEADHSESVVQQIIRPTGLLDPITYIYPKSGDYSLLLDSVDTLITKKPHVAEYLDGYQTDEEKLHFE
jgi:excinuclease UvrABC helicase subunit UvrB